MALCCTGKTESPRMTKVRVEAKPVPIEDKSLSTMPPHGRGILTAVPEFCASKVGDLVMRAENEFIFPRGIDTGSCRYYGAVGYRYRPLREADAITVSADYVAVEEGDAPAYVDLPLTDMRYGSWGILTAGDRRGQSVYRGIDGRFHYPNCSWDYEDGNSFYRYRPLQPGEKIIVEM